MRLASLLPVVLMLGACAPQAPDYAMLCIHEVGAPGEYEYFPSDGLPVVFPEQDATVAGAAEINACIRNKAARDGAL